MDLRICVGEEAKYVVTTQSPDVRVTAGVTIPALCHAVLTRFLLRAIIEQLANLNQREAVLPIVGQILTVLVVIAELATLLNALDVWIQTQIVVRVGLAGCALNGAANLFLVTREAKERFNISKMTQIVNKCMMT